MPSVNIQKLIDGADHAENALVEQTQFARVAHQARASSIVSGLLFGEESPQFRDARIRHLSALVGWCDAHLAGGPDEGVLRLRQAYALEIEKMGGA